MNKRKQIRERIKTILTFQDSSGYPTQAEGRVYTSRYAAIEPKAMPIICIYSYDETGDITPDQSGYNLSAGISVVIYAAGGDGTSEEQLKPTNAKDVDDYLDELCDEVEKALVKVPNNLSGPTPSDKGIVFRFIYQGVNYFVSGEGKKWTGVAVLDFQAEYKADLLYP